MVENSPVSLATATCRGAPSAQSLAEATRTPFPLAATVRERSAAQHIAFCALESKYRCPCPMPKKRPTRRRPKVYSVQTHGLSGAVALFVVKRLVQRAVEADTASRTPRRTLKFKPFR